MPNIQRDYKFKDKCYNVDKKKNYGRGTTYVWDKNQEKMVPIEERTDKAPEVDVPNISIYNTEWSYLSTGQHLTKSQLKEYCKKNGKQQIG